MMFRNVLNVLWNSVAYDTKTLSEEPFLAHVISLGNMDINCPLIALNIAGISVCRLPNQCR